MPLYKVTAVYEYFILAEDGDDALDLGVCEEQVQDSFQPDDHYARLVRAEETIPSGWREALVYTTDFAAGDIYVEDVWPTKEDTCQD